MYLRFFCLLSNLIFQFQHNATKLAIRFGYYDQTTKRHPFLGAFGYLFTVFIYLYSTFNREHKVELGLFYTINCLQILAEFVSGGQVFFVKIVRRGAAADIQPAHDLPAEIVGHEVKRSVRAGGSLLILIGHRGEENGLLFAHQRFIVGIKRPGILRVVS